MESAWWVQAIQQMINGVSLGSIYALIALGYTMVYGVMRLINFAHGDIYMLGAYVGFFCDDSGANVIFSRVDHRDGGHGYCRRSRGENRLSADAEQPENRAVDYGDRRQFADRIYDDVFPDTATADVSAGV